MKENHYWLRGTEFVIFKLLSVTPQIKSGYLSISPVNKSVPVFHGVSLIYYFNDSISTVKAAWSQTESYTIFTKNDLEVYSCEVSISEFKNLVVIKTHRG
jgi:hypothetical protein